MPYCTRERSSLDDVRSRADLERTRLDRLAVLEVEGPDTIRTKKGPKAGEEISLLKMILGDEQGSVCKLAAWREVAEVWGGSDGNGTAVKRGDVVLIESSWSFS